jgi:hypothetical protein
MNSKIPFGLLIYYIALHGIVEGLCFLFNYPLAHSFFGYLFLNSILGLFLCNKMSVYIYDQCRF